jgi:hypothetical protein
MKEKDSTGAHDGYAGPGTYILQGGKRIRVDPVMLNPEPESAPVKAPEEPKPVSPSAKKS